MSTEWSWEHGNDGASDADTQSSYAALINRSSTHSFSHHVWNALASLENTLMNADEALSARKYNSLLVNILDTGWPWAYNVEREDYLGRATMRRNDKVYASYILELPKKYNLMVAILNDTAGVPMYVALGISILTETDATLTPVEKLEASYLSESEIGVDTAAEMILFSPTPLILSGQSEIEAALTATPEIALQASLAADRPIAVIVLSADALDIVDVRPLGSTLHQDISSESWITEGGSAEAIDQQIAPLRSMISSSHQFDGESSRERALRMFSFNSSLSMRSVITADEARSSANFFISYFHIASRSSFRATGNTHAVDISGAIMASNLSSIYDCNFHRLFVRNGGRIRERSNLNTDSSHFRISKSTERKMSRVVLASEIQSSGNMGIAAIVPELLGFVRSTHAIQSTAPVMVETFNPSPLGQITERIPLLVESSLDNETQLTVAVQPLKDHPVIVSRHAIQMSVDVGMSMVDEILLHTEDRIHLVDGSWLYPIQTENDLFIQQANTIVQAGSNLRLS